MPEYLDHPVKDIKTWEENVKWRLDPKTEERYKNLGERMNTAKECAEKGMVIIQMVIGGYMYLRSLFGPVDLLYKFYDDPGIIHDCMRTWLELADSITAKHQQHLTIDELYFAEDICYNRGPLISPDMIKEFIMPYYQQLLVNMKSRQLDKNRHLYLHIDTDGFSDSVIPIYQEIGMDYLSPFEVASGCDVVRTGKQYPGLLISGGIDKRILAEGKDAIDSEIDRILPVMKKRGGYIPTCDHGVPEEVSFENYIHFRKRILEYTE
ncbi:MAG: uroporphyrinogen decarboxylase family protein [Clostridiales bacterium]|nr:uroporphyrinogen decarboxylase family protein [Clostridiales bacterium]